MRLNEALLEDATFTRVKPMDDGIVFEPYMATPKSRRHLSFSDGVLAWEWGKYQGGRIRLPNSHSC